MANYNDLITAIDSVIKTNNRREITGQLLQNVLNTMVGSLGENYQLAGFATPTTNPHQPDQNVFYVASQAGVYTQFDNIVLGDGISFLMWKNGAWTSQTISNVTQSWVQQNFVSKEWFRKVFRVYDEDGLEIVPNDMDSVVDNIKAMVGLWTNEYLSALGMGRDGGGTVQTLAQLNDVQLGTLENGDALVYNTAIHKWENKQIQTGVDMSVVWAALAANTNEQINASHLATALSGYVTSANLSTMLNDYATKAWAGQNFITVEWFDKLFQLYNGTEAEANKIAPNGALPVDQTQLNIEAMFGFWTKKYISALGQGDDGTSYTTLAQLNDVTLTNPTADQVLTYNGTHWVNRTLSLGSQTLAGLNDVAITTPSANQMLSYDATTQKWVNAAIPATGVTSVALSMPTGFSITGSPITASGTFTVTFASGYSLPTTAKQSNWDTAYGWGDHASAGYASASSLSNYLPLSGGTLTGDLVVAKGKDVILRADSTRQYDAGDIIFQNSSGTEIGRIWVDESYLKFMLRYGPAGSAYDIIHSGNIGSQSVASATKATQDDNGDTISSTYLKLTGGSLSGDLTIGNGGRLIMRGEGIELFHDTTPYIDFHYYNDSGDFSSRLKEYSYGVIRAEARQAPMGFHVGRGENGDYLQVGAIRFVYEPNNNALKIVKSDGSNANLYATGGISALGAGQESGGGGGDVTWTLLATQATNGRTIHQSYISGALSNYLPLSGGAIGGNIRFSGVESTGTNNTGYFRMGMFDETNGGLKMQLGGNATLQLLDKDWTMPLLLVDYNGNGRVWGSWSQGSDARFKTVIKDVDLSVEQIAKMPAILYRWNDREDTRIYAGSIAQNWESILPQVTDIGTDPRHFHSLQYGVAALISAITIARKVMTHEEKIALLETRVSALEKENGEQEQLINSLQEELTKFKAA